jgi:serine/threonine-protein kinase
MADLPETAPTPVPMIGSYRLVEPLGSGGMSSVFRAVHQETGHEVAVKVLPRYLAKNPTLLQRFLREAKSAESLEDPNVVAIYDRGSEAGRYYLVLEYVPGGDLHDRVREGGPLPVKEAIDVVRQVASGLKHAAGRGLIHRDIKPANILRTPDGRVKVTDLGLALHTEEEDERVTRDGTTVGTVDYMAPEQARDSRAASARSDIYSLGCTTYYLLTGVPPFAGGDIAEKLKAHATQPAPSAHITRPEVPEILARLVQKMMAKKPEKRFRDYDQLLEALDAISASLDASSGAMPAPPLMALIDDEDDDDELMLPAPAPLLALIDEEDDDTTRGRNLLALIDDEDDSFALGPGGPSRSPNSTASSPIIPSGSGSGSSTPTPDQWDLTNLAAIESQSPSAKKPPTQPIPSAAGSRDGSGPQPVAGPPPEELYDIAPPIELPTHLYQLPPPETPGTPASTWVIRLCLLASAVMLLAFGWSQLSPRLTEEQVAPVTDPFLEANGGGGTKAGHSGRSPVAWSEPADRDEPTPQEPPVPKDVLARLGMPDAAAEAAPRDEAPDVSVRRIDAVRDNLNLSDLPRAFDKLSGVVGVADDGPIFEENFKIAGQERVLRARPGYRPIVVVTRPDSASVKARPASFVLDRQRLVIEGIDFVVNGADLSPRQESMFLCRGSELTLRDCTITVVGPIKHPYAVVQTGERGAVPSPPSSTVRFERTWLRGDASAIRLAGAAEVTFARSAVSCGKGPAIAIAGEAGAKRSVAIFRSTFATRGSFLDVIGSAGSADAVPATIRASESTFAAIGGGKPPEFVAMNEVPAGPARGRLFLTWRGEANRFSGWAGWSSASPQGILTTVRGETPGAERKSSESSTAWPESAVDPWAVSPVPAAVAKDLAAPALRVARPAAMIREKTLGTFARSAIGGSAASGRVQGLTFDADDAAFNGDLGHFLAERPRSQARAIQVEVVGSGRHDFTPIALPEGVSLAISVSPPKAGTPPLVWSTPEGSRGQALIAVKDAELSLSGVRLAATPKTSLEFLVAVNHGNLFLNQCVLMGPGEVENESVIGGLVLFRTDGTRPFPWSSGADVSPGGRPACVLTDSALITGGDALTAEVGRGLVALKNCAIASEASAIVLRPEKVRRNLFEADLILDRCTVAAERNVVSLDAWPGLPPGPDRPWVVWSSSCVLSDAYQRGGGLSPGVALRTAIGGLDRGALSWDSSHDAYDLAQFTSAGAALPPSGRGDLNRSWVDLWGANHVRSPLPRGSVRFVVDRLKGGEIEPGDLALDPKFPAGRKALDVGADVSRFGLPTTNAPPLSPGH